jgi:hypothetical protein
MDQSHSSKGLKEENAEKLAESSTKTNLVLFKRFLAGLAFVQYMPQNSTRLQEAANLGKICASIARGRPEAENIFGRQTHGPGLHPPYSLDMVPH